MGRPGLCSDAAGVGTLARSLAMDWESFYRNYRQPGYVPGYEIGNRLGAGVFGVVFKARKPSIGKFYAIKFLRVDDPSLKEAVARELETVRVFAEIDHPNLVSIEDCGEVDGIPYIVMGYAGEETLRTRIDKGALPEEEALPIFVQVCRGVHALHERGLAHFDLKPANVFLKGSLARVGDYGLSKLISATRQTLSFGRGTPYYMPPEMLHRRGDHRSDLYSLGVMFYEMLAGEVPFKGETDWEVLKRHETDPVRFPPAFPTRYSPVVERLMEKAPERRYGEVSAVLAELGESRAPAAPAGTCAPASASAPVEAPSVAPDGRGAREWVRPGEGEVVGGVCRGLANRFDLPVAPIRAAFLLLTFFVWGVGLSVYVVLWIAMPKERSPRLEGRRRDARGRGAAPRSDSPGEPGLAYAGFWRRVAAALLDLVVLGFLALPVLAFLSLARRGAPFPFEARGMTLFSMLLAFLAPGLVWLYFAGLESSPWRGTLGKRAFGLAVTDLDGGRLTLLRATGRFFAKVLSVVTAGVGFLLAGFTRRKQALHDLVADSLVVRERGAAQA